MTLLDRMKSGDVVALEALDTAFERLSGRLGRMQDVAAATLPALTDGLRAPDADVRRICSSALGRLGPFARPSLPQLFDAIIADRIQPRSTAIWAAARIGPDSPAWVPVLVRALTDADVQTRMGACYAIGTMGDLAAPAIPALAQLLDEDDWNSCEPALAALTALGRIAEPALPALVAQSSRDRPWSLRALATVVAIDGAGDVSRSLVTKIVAAAVARGNRVPLTLMGWIDPSGRIAIPLLAAYLSDSSPLTRAAAATELAGFGVRARAVLPELIAVTSREPFVADSHDASAARSWGEPWDSPSSPYFDLVDAVARIAPREEFLRLCLRLLERREPGLRLAMIDRLLLTGREDPAVIARMVHLASSGDGPVRESAIRAVGRIGPKAAAAVPALIELVRSNAESREPAIYALQAMGTAAGAAVECLVPILVDADARMAEVACSAIEGIDKGWNVDPATLAATIERDTRSADAVLAAIRIRRLGRAAGAALPALRVALRSEFLPLRDPVIRALGGLGPSAKAAVPTLVAMLRSEVLATRRDWERAESRGEPGDSGLHPLDVELRRSVTTSYREPPTRAILTALRKIGPDAEEALPDLREMAHEEPAQSWLRLELDRTLDVIAGRDPDRGAWQSIVVDASAELGPPRVHAGSSMLDLDQEWDGSWRIAVLQASDDQGGTLWPFLYLSIRRTPDGHLQFRSQSERGGIGSEAGALGSSVRVVLVSADWDSAEFLEGVATRGSTHVPFSVRNPFVRR